MTKNDVKATLVKEKGQHGLVEEKIKFGLWSEQIRQDFGEEEEEEGKQKCVGFCLEEQGTACVNRTNEFLSQSK